ncbi:MAG: MGDG synthase family glycosyltransferase [Eubacteriales bacterium]
MTVGAGHKRAAEALKKAALETVPGAEAVILDTFRYASPFVEKMILGTYMEILKVSPVVYGFLYRQSERGQPLSGRGKTEFNRILNLLAAPRLVEYIKNFEPQAVVCTHPFPLGIVSLMKKRGTFKGLLTAAITDFTLHTFWVFPEVDQYFIGAEGLYAQYEEFSIDRSRVRATGIPIDPAFTQRNNREELRAGLDLTPGVPVVLILGGGLGMGPLEAAVQSLLKSPVGCQIMVVTGTNKQLYDKLTLTSEEAPHKLKVFGYVDNIHELMMAADMMAGKAGGLTCAEALACGLPIFLVDPLPGQEERNVEFLTSTGAAVSVNDKDLAGIVGSYLNEPGRLREMARASARLGRPRAAYEAINTLEALLSGAGEIITCLRP